MDAIEGKSEAVRKFLEGKSTTINMVETFHFFWPRSAGSYDDWADLIIKGINDTVPGISGVFQAFGLQACEEMTTDSFVGANRDDEEAVLLQRLMNDYGSDKGARHDYYRVYSHILKPCHKARKLLEIGLGTNNTDVVSNMGANGRPGASLRAFRDYLPGCRIYGADIDDRVLFSEDRIETFFLDQTERATFATLGDKIGDEFDVMIDDGLHAPHANLNSLAFFLPRLRDGGWAVIEDIPPSTIELWRTISMATPSQHRTCLIRTQNAYMFLLNKGVVA